MSRAIFAINQTASGVSIDDLSGLYIDAYDTVDLRLFFSIDEIDHSEDLFTAISGGLIILNDGVQDLTLEESEDLSTIPTFHDVPETFLDLTDTPTTYSGYGSALAVIKITEDRLIFDTVLSGIQTSDPVDDDDIANKKYVDDLVSSSVGGGDAYIAFGDSSGTELGSGLLKVVGGSTLGYVMPLSGTVTSIGVITDASNINTYKLLKNTSEIESITLSGTTSGVLSSPDSTFVSGDVLTAEFSTGGESLSQAYTPDSNTLFLAHFDGDSATYRHVTNSSTVASGMSGRIDGAAVGVSGKFDYAVDFDGSNDYIEFLHHDDYDTQDVTVEMFFKADDLTGRQHIFSKDSSGYDTGGHLSFGINGDEIYVRSQTSSSSAEHTTSGKNISAGTWYHLAVVLGTGGMKVFLDGTSVYTNGGWTQGLNGNREPFVLGASLQGNGNSYLTSLGEYFHGKICEFRMSNTRRYETGFTPTSTKFNNDSNTLGLWHMDESTGSLVYDSSDTIHNAMMQDSGSGATIDGSTVKFGTHSIKMNNSRNDWLRFIHNPKYESDEITVEGWVRPFLDQYDGIIFQKGDSSTEGGLQAKWIDTGDKVEVKYWGASTSRTITTVTDSFDANAWTHLAITLDANNFKVYVNGVLSSSESLTADFQNVWTNNKDDFYIGALDNNTVNLQAYLDEIRISDVVRTYASSSVKEISMIVGVR